MSTLFGSDSKITAIYQTFAKELDFFIWSTNFGTQKTDDTMLHTYKMVIAVFLVMDKANKIRLFEKTFLVANVSLKVVFGILFFILSNANVDVLGHRLWWRTYTTQKALPTITKCIKLVKKKEFAATILNLKQKTFIVDVASLTSVANTYLSYRF